MTCVSASACRLIAHSFVETARKLFVVALLSIAGANGAAAQAPAGVAPSSPWLVPSADTVLTRIAFGSCLDQRRPQAIWRSIIARSPQLFLMLGDNVYGDVRSSELKELKDAYRLQAAQPQLAAARATLPFLATWDDHDYGMNDARGDFVYKDGARALFAAFWQIDPATLPDGGIYRSHIIGPPGRRVQVILLDLRSYRSPFSPRPLGATGPGRYVPSDDPERTMLGAAQWSWLEAELRKPAEVRLLVSSIQVLAEAHHWERWGHFPVERDRLAALIAKTGAAGVILLSGDRHRAAMYQRTTGVPYPLLEVTSSSLNRPFAARDPDDPGRIGDMITTENFGEIDIDWTARTLRTSINGLDGSPQRERTLLFDAIGIR